MSKTQPIAHDIVLEYLDSCVLSGMIGSEVTIGVIIEEFGKEGINRKEAKDILNKWKKNSKVYQDEEDE